MDAGRGRLTTGLADWQLAGSWLRDVGGKQMATGKMLKMADGQMGQMAVVHGDKGATKSEPAKPRQQAEQAMVQHEQKRRTVCRRGLRGGPAGRQASGAQRGRVSAKIAQRECKAPRQFGPPRGS